MERLRRTVLLLFLLTQPMSRYVHHVSLYKHLSLERLYSGVPLQGQGLGNLHKLLLITMRFGVVLIFRGRSTDKKHFILSEALFTKLFTISRCCDLRSETKQPR